MAKKKTLIGKQKIMCQLRFNQLQRRQIFETRSQSKFRTSKKRGRAIDILCEQNKKQKIL